MTKSKICNNADHFVVLVVLMAWGKVCVYAGVYRSRCICAHACTSPVFLLWIVKIRMK